MTPFAWLLALSCVVCYTGQNLFNKLYSLYYTGEDSCISAVFSVIYGLVVSLFTFAYNGFSFHPSLPTVLLGLGCGVVLFLFNLSLIQASRSGPYAFQSLMMVFGSILISYLFSAIYWGDSFSTFQLVGMGVMLLSFVVFNCRGFHFEDAKKEYFLWVTFLLLSNGAYSILVDAQQRVMIQTERAEMIIILFTFSEIISLGQLIARKKGKVLQPFKQMNKRTWLFAILSSVCAAIAVNIMMLAITLVPASVLFTIDNGGVLILCTLFGAILFREKIQRHMWIGIAIAIVSFVLLSLG